MARKGRHIFLANNLPQLQNLIKRDPNSYKEEFNLQHQHFESAYVIFQLQPNKDDEKFCKLINFLSQVVPYYPDQAKGFADKLIGLLSQHFMILNPEIRKGLVQGLILLKNRSVVSSLDVLSLFFKLFRCQDAALREILYNFIIQDIKNQNDNRLNKVLQNFMYKMLGDSSEIAAKKSLDVMIELYRKNVWNDQKTVNVISEGCFSAVLKISVTALKFFLGEISVLDDKTEEIDESEIIDSLMHSSRVGGKSKSKTTKIERALAAARKKGRKQNKDNLNFSAIHLLNDPQGFSEKMYSKLVNSSDRFSVRLLMMDVLSKVIGVHKTLVLQFYSYITKYLNPHQQDVTQILKFAAQGCHEFVPPDAGEVLLKTIAHNFVSDHCSGNVITVGLNAIREICARCPLAMSSILLSDLVMYKKYKDKGVVSASRSLIQLFREKNPELLPKKELGKENAISKSVGLSFGQVQVATGVFGLDKLAAVDELEEEWEEVSQSDMSDDDEGSWIDVNDEDSDINIDDDETEETSEQKEKSLVDQQKILSPQEFLKLEELTKSNTTLAGVKRDVDQIVEVSNIEKNLKRSKQNYEERMESIKGGREGREKFGSKKGKKEKSGASKTNKEKEKKKNFVMMVHKRSITAKSKMSLREKQKALLKHATKQKKRM